MINSSILDPYFSWDIRSSPEEPDVFLCINEEDSSRTFLVVGGFNTSDMHFMSLSDSRQRPPALSDAELELFLEHFREHPRIISLFLKEVV